MDKRQALIDAAANLAHTNGFGATTLAMVAEESGVPLGNVYYYFRTKEALADAVLDKRLCELDAMLESFEQAGSPRAQLLAMLKGVRATAEKVAESGCAFGRLSQDVGADLRAEKAIPVARMTAWAEKRLKELGLSPSKARDAALHFLSALQGASLLAWVNHDPKLLERETRTLETWVAGL